MSKRKTCHEEDEGPTTGYDEYTLGKYRRMVGDFPESVFLDEELDDAIRDMVEEPKGGDPKIMEIIFFWSNEYR